MHRRHVPGPTLLLLAACLAGAGPAAAQQAEWAQDYEAARPALAAARAAAPILSADTYAATGRAAEAYRAAVARGGWASLSGTEGLRLGASGPAVAALRRRLVEAGDLPDDGGSQTYDAYAKAAVQAFQARHGLTASGAMNAQTQRAMNVTADVRLRQLETNLVRLASYQVDLGRRHVTVNIPGALVETVEDGRVASRHAAGVGKVDRQSPVMNARITEINFNPFWNAPASIIRKDLIPKMQKDPGYLARNRIRIFSGETEIQPAAVNWNSDEGARYRYRQDPGADVNAMGFVRINIPNPHGVYMHDTPDKGIYREDWRFISSGCVRVQNVRGYVAWLLRDTPGWDEARIAEAVESGGRIDAPLAQPVPVYWTYVTAWSSADGTVQFRDDIYGKDPAAHTESADLAPPPGRRPEPSPYGRVEAVPERTAAAEVPDDLAEDGDPTPPAEVGRPVRTGTAR
jgi:murein L,D-transpeptidase YcbB/YkuD